MRRAKRFAPVPQLDYVRFPGEIIADERRRAEEMFPFPVDVICKRRYDLWVCKAPPPGHAPCTCWPAGMPTIEDAIQDLALEQLGMKGKRVGPPQEREPLPFGDGLAGGGDE